MFQKETRKLEKQIVELLQDQDIPVRDDLDWSPVPFSGEWGIATSFFKIAAQEAKSGRKGSVPERAEELAALVADKLPALEYFPRVEAVGGYLNLYFDSRIFSTRVVNSILSADLFGKGEDKKETVMVEFSNLNTHKAFHVGHLRSTILGDVLCRVLEYAGYNVIRANYTM